MAVKTILVVDDCEPDQFLIKVMLESVFDGVEVLRAYDGEEALEVLSGLESEPEIIFLDINMPRMDGHEFLAEYCKNYKGYTKVMMLTSSYRDEDKDNAQSYCCVKEYLTKPLSLEALKSLVS